MGECGSINILWGGVTVVSTIVGLPYEFRLSEDAIIIRLPPRYAAAIRIHPDHPQVGYTNALGLSTRI